MKKETTNRSVLSRAGKVRRRLINAAVKEPFIIMTQLDNSEDGFDEEQVDESRDEFGSNAITSKKKDNIFKMFFRAFINPFTIILLLIASFSLFVEADVIASTIIFFMVFVSGLLKFVQETRNTIAADKLTKMVQNTVHVRRQVEDEETEEIESKKIEIPLEDLVVGDIVYLAAGDMIPADVRILRAKDLFVSESALTGESEPLEKFAAKAAAKISNPLEYNNLAFMGTSVVSGSAEALVLAVGDDTIFGGIAQAVQAKTAPTSFDKGIKTVSWVLIRFMLVMVPMVLVLNGVTTGDWGESMLFALAVAVGLTPEMLPMIVSANLAKGAVFMSRKKVIVKDINSIQNFGAMDVLCTDKTGTLTQDKVVLQYHLDVHGKEDDRVLSRAYLNSYYQTGLKNLMDVSIIEKAIPLGIVERYKNNTKVDEIPFDFNRRLMSVVIHDPETKKTRIITKGAVEEVLSRCTNAEYGGKTVDLTKELRAEIMERVYNYNEDGMRVIAVAQRYDEKPKSAYGVADEKGLTLIGYLAFLDPPKESARTAIEALNEHGVKVKVLTGDNDAVTRCVCRQVGISVGKVMLGSDIENMSEAELREAVEKANVFAKLSPAQKARVVTALRENGHVVGFMGDGINDAAAMKAADVSISVDTAVDIAKESANIILLEKDLMVLEQGILEGRKTYGNIIKYIKMTASSNFGNMFAVLAASAFIPFLPMLPIQILALNLIYDISCISMPWDNVDKEFLRKPRRWEAKSMTRFMMWLGPASSLFDISCYAMMFWWISPAVAGGAWGGLTAAQEQVFISVFQSGWFVLSLWTQMLVIHMIRSPKFPFIGTRASAFVTVFTIFGIAIGTVMPFLHFAAEPLGMMALPWEFLIVMSVNIIGFLAFISLIKVLYIKRYKELL